MTGQQIEALVDFMNVAHWQRHRALGAALHHNQVHLALIFQLAHELKDAMAESMLADPMRPMQIEFKERR